jgi:general secretion pathway protein L
MPDSLPNIPIPGLGTFFRWWMRQLAEFQQDILRLLPTRSAGRLELTIGKNDCVLRIQTGFEEARAFAAATPDDLRGVFALLSRKGRWVVHLCLSPDVCLCRSVSLPAPALDQIERVLALEIERSTPFDIEDIYHGHCILTDDAPERVAVQHIIVKKSLIEPWLLFFYSKGLQPASRVKILPEQTTFLAEFSWKKTFSSVQEKMRRFRRRALVAATCCALLLLSAAFWRQSIALASLSHTVASARERAMEARTKLTILQSHEDRLLALYHIRVDEPPILTIWNELAKFTPDSAWLYDLRIEKRSVVLSGFAQSAAELRDALEASPIFENASLDTPAAGQPLAAGEHFTLRVALAAFSPTERISLGLR